MKGEPTEADPGTIHATILVVEDDAAVREAAVWVLKLYGFDAREAADGPAALQVLEANPDVDLVFSDVVMPKGMSGLELAQEILRRYPGLKVLLTTGYADLAVEGTALNDSGIRLISKPYANDEFIATLKEMLQES